MNIHIVGKFGFRQPLYFPFTLSYWGYGCGCGGEKGSRKYHHKGKHNKNNGEMINSNYWCLSYLYLGVNLQKNCCFLNEYYTIAMPKSNVCRSMVLKKLLNIVTLLIYSSCGAHIIRWQSPRYLHTAGLANEINILYYLLIIFIPLVSLLVAIWVVCSYHITRQLSILKHGL